VETAYHRAGRLGKRRKVPHKIKDRLDQAVFLMSKQGKSVAALGVAGFSRLLEEFSGQGFLFSILDGGGFFEVLALFPLADDALFLNHALEALDGFLEGLAFFYRYLPNNDHLPSIGSLILPETASLSSSGRVSQ